MENLILDFSGDTLTAVLMGDMDHHGVAGVRTQIDDAMFRLMPKILCIELSGVEFMDSSGLGLILGRYQKASDLGIEVMLSNPSPKTEQLIVMTGIDQMIQIKKKEA